MEKLEKMLAADWDEDQTTGIATEPDKILDHLTHFMEKHTLLLTEIIRLTQRIKILAAESRLNLVSQETENRQRQINLLAHFQDKIENLIYQINIEKIGKETFELLRLWQFNFNKLVETINEIDDEIISILENAKDITAREISTLFKNKESFRGYNLQNVKK